MEYKKGDKVKHPKQDVWGMGVVLEDQHDDKIRIFFESVGEKILSTKFISPTRVEGEAAKHPILDKLKANSKFLGLTILYNNFVLKFPNGFQDQDFIDKEITAKRAISTFANEQLSQEKFRELLDHSQYEEIIKIIHTLIQKDIYSLIDRFEKIALTESLENSANHGVFSVGLYELLYGDEASFEDNFMDFADILTDMKAGKWPTITYFLFIFFPKEHIFIKPTITQNIAKICEFNLSYEASLNFETYQSARKLANYLFKNLKDVGLSPSDMMDIQSFMWVVEKY